MTEAEVTTQLPEPPLPRDPTADFGSDHHGIQEAARAHAAAQTAPVEVIKADRLPDIDVDPATGIEKGLSPRTAARALTDHREEKAAHAERFQRALAGELPLDFAAEAKARADIIRDESLSDEERQQAYEELQGLEYQASLRSDKVTAAQQAIEKQQAALAEAQQRQDELERRLNEPEPQQPQQQQIDWGKVSEPQFRNAANTLQANWNAAGLGYIRSVDDIQALNQHDPARAQLAWQLIHNATQLEQGYVQAHRQQQFNQAAAVEDAKVAKAHPEVFSDKRVTAEVTNGVAQMLTEKLIKHGVARTPEDAAKQLQWAWSGGIPQMRTAWGQEMLLNAYRYERLMSRPSPRPVVPTVQRPGVAGSGIAPQEWGARAAMQRLNETGSLKDAAKVRAAQIRARRR
jgi:hypothetical protein